MKRQVLISLVGKRSEHWLGFLEAMAERDEFEIHLLATDLTEITIEAFERLEAEHRSFHFLHAPFHLGEDLTGHMASILYGRGAWDLCPPRVDVIHVIGEAGYPTTRQIVSLRNRRYPGVPITLYAAQNVLQKFPQPFRSFERTAFKEISTALPISRDAEQVLRSKGYQGNAVQVPLGVDTEFFTRRTTRPPSDRFTVGFIGRIETWKGIDQLVDAAERTGCHLLLVGEGSQREWIEAEAQRRGIDGQIEFFGWATHDQMPDLLARMDVLALPSIEIVQKRALPWLKGVRLREQFGRVLVEAMSCGVPTIGSELGEIPTVIGEAGLTYPVGDVDALASAIERLRDEPGLAVRLGEIGADRAREHYSWSAIGSLVAGAWRDAHKHVPAPLASKRSSPSDRFLRGLARIGSPELLLKAMLAARERGPAGVIHEATAFAGRRLRGRSGRSMAPEPIPSGLSSNLPIPRVNGIGPARPSEALQINYVTEATNISGGHRLVFEHLNRLADRGHNVALFTLAAAPEWFELRVPVHTFSDYAQLESALAAREGIKVATWWATAESVRVASAERGRGVYFVQEIETSRYPDEPAMRARVRDSYSDELTYLTQSGWNVDRLAEMDHAATMVAPGIDLTSYPRADGPRDRALAAVGRSHYLKNLFLTWQAWIQLPDPKPPLRLFGTEPELGHRYRATYLDQGTDREVADLIGRSEVFIQTSVHEGFCLPILESMAVGTPVICTDAHGNRDFCRDGENCLVVPADAKQIAQGLKRLFGDADLRDRLAIAGLETAREFDWPRRIDELEHFYRSISGSPPATTKPIKDKALS